MNLEPCPANQYNNGSAKACTACALGSFKNASGDAACAACSSLLGPYNTTLQPASANASACVCWPGYELVGGTCQLTTTACWRSSGQTSTRTRTRGPCSSRTRSTWLRDGKRYLQQNNVYYEDFP